MTTIRKAEITDVSTIRSIAEKTWPVCYASIISPAQIRYMLDLMYSEEKIRQAILDSKHDFFVLNDGNHDQAFCGIEYGFPTNNSLRLHKLYVLPQTQKSGFGKELIRFLESLAREKQLHQLHLNVNKNNPALEFYRRMGFEIETEEQISIGEGFIMDDFVLVKPLI